LSYYSDASLCRRLKLDLLQLSAARQQLQQADLIAFRKPLYQVLKEYVRLVRPPRKPAFLMLEFAPGECAQVDWGQYGSVPVGSTRRRLSFFVMVLC